jgi:SPP1 family predicted phage head-tail adaptor
MTIPGPKSSITFQRNTGTATDGMSDSVLPVWTTLFTVRGGFGTVSGAEAIIAGQDTLVATHRLYVVYKASTTGTLTEDDQAVVDGTTYRILWIDNPAAIKQALIIKIKEVAI